MFSLGIDASLALRTAFSSTTLVSGSPPPSRAATMIARESLENCAPLRESTIAFLCLMLDHFECPDIPRSLRIRTSRARPARHAALGGRVRGHIGCARMSAAPSAEIFKAYDLRGLYPEQIDGDVAEQI